MGEELHSGHEWHPPVNVDLTITQKDVKLEPGGYRAEYATAIGQLGLMAKDVIIEPTRDMSLADHPDFKTLCRNFLAADKRRNEVLAPI
jgi:hypothetical protein